MGRVSEQEVLNLEVSPPNIFYLLAMLEKERCGIINRRKEVERIKRRYLKNMRKGILCVCPGRDSAFIPVLQDEGVIGELSFLGLSR